MTIHHHHHHHLSHNLSHNLDNKTFNHILKTWSRATKTGSLTSLVHYINLQADKGYRAAIIGTPDWHYRQLPAYSNSHLTAIRDQLLGRRIIQPARAFVFGTAFHELLLEPDKAAPLEDYMLRPAEQTSLLHMLDAARRDPLLQFATRCPLKEHVCTWTDPLTQLPCKAKLDTLIPDTLLTDLKTTAATSQEAFEHTIRKYEYDRQMAFYMDGARVPEAILIGIQKQKPYSVFHVTFANNSPEIRQARQRYRFILKKAQQCNFNP